MKSIETFPAYMEIRTYVLQYYQKSHFGMKLCYVCILRIEKMSFCQFEVRTYVYQSVPKNKIYYCMSVDYLSFIIFSIFQYGTVPYYLQKLTKNRLQNVHFLYTRTLRDTLHYLTAHVVCSKYLKNVFPQGTITKQQLYCNTVPYELIRFQYSC